ncbi:hypothetical protein AVEN_46278-1 [Araneus ventricosus]|uniref:Uncharacterized protein n=1 Tax=Araneus ventricosus TaxID=182803 RepID=A0A4Y2I6S5_ARAVE|nr:hypothetical protein AVEN_46278-1 [Araneus ventricosus]
MSRAQFTKLLAISFKNLQVLPYTLCCNCVIPTDFPPGSVVPTGSTDMGNVSHVIPSIHPFFDIGTEAINHAKEFTEASGDPKSQGPTLKVAKVLALTALKLMRCPDTLQKVKKQFEADIGQDL